MPFTKMDDYELTLVRVEWSNNLICLKGFITCRVMFERFHYMQTTNNNVKTTNLGNSTPSRPDTLLTKVFMLSATLLRSSWSGCVWTCRPAASFINSSRASGVRSSQLSSENRINNTDYVTCIIVECFVFTLTGILFRTTKNVLNSLLILNG